jgi:chromosome partitioning protein
MIILIGGTKGGGGKSTIGVNVAIGIAHHVAKPDSVFIVDADSSQSTATDWIGTRMTYQIKPEIKCAKKNSDDSPKALALNLKKLNESYDYVLVDAGGYDGPSFRAALTVCDLLIFPIQPTQVDLWAVRKTKELIDQSQIINPDMEVLAVISRGSTNSRSTVASDAQQLLAETYEFRVANTVIRDRLCYQNSVSEGKGVVESTDAKAKAEIEALVLEIINGTA